MSQVYTTKLFKNGASQAVRLPAEFRFSGQEVYIFRDEITGDIVLSEKPRPKAGRIFSLRCPHPRRLKRSWPSVR